MRFNGICYRAHDPRWSFQPLSGEGAAARGARFNPRGTPALYLSLDIVTAVKEISQGFARKIEPCVLCSYDVDCEDIVDLRTEKDQAENDLSLDDMACAWFSDLSRGREPPSWTIARTLITKGCAGILTPSFAPGATPADQNLVLWKWSSKPPYRVTVHDPSGRLPKNRLSWR